MGSNELFLWLSARRSGSWAQFRAMVDDLRLNGGDSGASPGWTYQRFRYGLAGLGHVVFNAEAGGLSWRVSPPALALGNSNDRPVGILLGARTIGLLRHITENVPASSLEVVTNQDGPDTFRISADSVCVLQQIAAASRIAWQPEGPVGILARTRTLTLPSSGEAQLPFGRDVTVERFIATKRRCYWEPVVGVAAAEGLELYRFTRWYVRDHFLLRSGRAFPIDGQKGKFLVLRDRRRQVLRYNQGQHSLTIPPICRPPLSIDRALILCTGIAPKIEPVANGRALLVYRDIPSDLAGLVGEVLHQPNL